MHQKQQSIRPSRVRPANAPFTVNAGWKDLFVQRGSDQAERQCWRRFLGKSLMVRGQHVKTSSYCRVSPTAMVNEVFSDLSISIVTFLSLHLEYCAQHTHSCGQTNNNHRLAEIRSSCNRLSVFISCHLAKHSYNELFILLSSRNGPINPAFHGSLLHQHLQHPEQPLYKSRALCKMSR